MKFFDGLYPLFFVGLEVSKALASESLLTFCRNRQLPFPNSLVTLLPEVLKSIVSLFFLEKAPTLRYAHLFLAHSFLYFLNNALYILLLKHTSASAIQFWTLVKLPVTALMHSWFIKPQRNKEPWLALLMIFVGVVFTQLDSSLKVGSFLVLFVCILLALNSATAAIYNELLLKSLSLPFWEQQSWISCLGAFWNSIYFVVELESVSDFTKLPNSATKNYFLLNILIVVSLSAYVGIIVGFLVKKFDSVVKLQSSAISTVLIGIFSSILFSKKIRNPVSFAFGSIIIVIFTTVYAKLNASQREYEKLSKNEMPKIRFMFGIIVFLLLIGCVTLFSIYK